MREFPRNESKLSPEKITQIIWARDVDGLSFKDIGKNFGINSSYVARIHHRFHLYDPHPWDTRNLMNSKSAVHALYKLLLRKNELK